MLVTAEVSGNTYPFRHILQKRFGLKWKRNHGVFSKRMENSGNNLRRLAEYCNEFRLTLRVNGAVAGGVRGEGSKNGGAIDDFDLFVLDIEGKESPIPGKLGGMPPAPGPSEDDLKFAEIAVCPDTVPSFDVTPWFEGTRFPEPRDEQAQLLPLITEALHDGYENIIVECPTGSGKSALAMMIPKMLDSDAYISTHLKGLQAQYMREMPFMRSVMGRANYTCNLHVPAGLRNVEAADTALALHEDGLEDTSITPPKANLAPCRTCGPKFKCSYKPPAKEGRYDWKADPDKMCDYFAALTNAQRSRFFISNNYYLMGLGQAGEAMLPTRDLLICDEAHHLPDALTSFYAMDISIRHLERLIGFPTFDDTTKADDNSLARQRTRALEPWSPSTKDAWGFPKVPSIKPKTENRIRDIGSKVWLAYLGKLRQKIAARIEAEEYDEKDLSFAYNYVQTLLHLEVSLENNHDNWVWTKDDEDDPMFVSFKPIEIGEDAESMLLRLGRQRIFMSATIPSPDVFMRELGMNKEKTLFLKVDYSSFPTGNRPIITTIKGGKMSYGGRNDDAFTETANAILQIMDLHDHEKGIILPYTNEIEEKLYDEIKRLDPDAHDRLMTHSKEATDREEVLAEFEICPDPAVLLSTYVNQGYDGKHCGFAIIVKIPFPPLGDVRTVKKMERDEDWYKAETAGSLIQMCGRVVRSVDDTGITYIVDPSFDFHYNKGINNQPLKNYMPSYIDEAIM